jgi:glyoxylase-like metal-dependent hydrolase (beta-lactamase superfamily II)
MRNPTWKIIHIGYLRRNQFWDEEEILRGQACTTVLIETESRRILVDPGLSSLDDLRAALFQRAGLRPEDIDTIFLTHFHRCHWQGVSLFSKSAWLMSRAEIRWRQQHRETADEEQNILARIVPFEDHPIRGIELIPTPGHSRGSASLLFETREGMVVVAGDAVLTFDHFEDREPSEMAEDAKEARRSISYIAKIADAVAPGHDNYFVV